MGRLIDADVLLREVSLEASFMPCGKFATENALKKWIEKQPTAYDVDQVVEGLKKEKELHTEHYNDSLYKDYPDVKRRYRQIQFVINKAIDIVKRGGVE